MKSKFQKFSTVVLASSLLLSGAIIPISNNVEASTGRPPQYSGKATVSLTNSEAIQWVKNGRKIALGTLQASWVSLLPKVGALIGAGMGTTGAIANNMAERIESANNSNGVTITYDKFGSTKITAR